MNVIDLSSKLKQPQQPQDHRRSIAKQKFAWIERILMDQEITDLAFRVAVLISKYLNLTSGDAWPSQPRLAADLGVTTRGIQKALDALVAAGYLAVEVSKGRSLTNRYLPIFEPGNTNRGSSINEQKDERGFAITPSKTRTATPENTNRCSIKHEPPFVENSTKRTLSNRTLSKNLSEGKNLPAIAYKPDFEEWYRQYPRHVAKEKAEKAYAAIISKKKATPAELLASAIRFAEERRGQDDKFTPYPASWLNAGRWQDEPQQRSNRTGRDAIIAGLQSFLQER